MIKYNIKSIIEVSISNKPKLYLKIYKEKSCEQITYLIKTEFYKSCLKQKNIIQRFSSHQQAGAVYYFVLTMEGIIQTVILYGNLQGLVKW